MDLSEPLDLRQPIEIPGLATVILDVIDPRQPILVIRLDPGYNGDLRDIAQDPRETGDPDIFLRCNQTTALDNAALARFMEVLSQWDYTGDGVPDCEQVVEAIEQALYLSREKPFDFHRPRDGWYSKLVMSIMPPAPPWHIVFGFGNIKKRFRLRHYLVAPFMLALILGLVTAQIHYVPWTVYSVISGINAIVRWVGLPSWVASIVVGLIIGTAVNRALRGKKGESSLSRHTYGFFNRAAVFEEQAFREGSENWTIWQRVRSCVAFGAIHMTNMIYPLATIVPLALGGAMFMTAYLSTYRKTKSRRAAVLNAAVWHRIYNRMAFVVLVVVLIASFGPWLLGLVTCVFTAQIVTDLHLRRRHARKATLHTQALNVAVVK